MLKTRPVSIQYACFDSFQSPDDAALELHAEVAFQRLAARVAPLILTY